MGRLLVSSILNRDYAVVQGIVLLFAVGFVVVNLVVDLAYGLADPRIRLATR
jgi:ABC-type dipeptide/oligopeptide/nickel transport system permease component